MKVSLRRKIHIMALPQETFLNARWSEDQSAAIPQTGREARALVPRVGRRHSRHCIPLILAKGQAAPRMCRRTASRIARPDAEEVVPVQRQSSTLETLRLLHWSRAHLAPVRPSATRPPSNVQRRAGRDQVEEAARRAGRHAEAPVPRPAAARPRAAQRGRQRRAALPRPGRT